MTSAAAPVRATRQADLPALIQLWHDGWRDAHADLLPAKVIRQRTFDSFRERMEMGLSKARVVGPVGDPGGMAWIEGDELYQFYVHRRARGSGVARALMTDTERQFADHGIGTAWLACAIGNDRAARFYEKCGWRNVGTMVNVLHLPQGDYPLETWRFERVMIR